MKTMVGVCLVAICLVKAASVPVVGTWEARQDGRKAITVSVKETEGIIGGTVVFYIIHDDAEGKLDGTAVEPEGMKGTTWDGNVLRFRAGPAAFEMRMTGADKAELKVMAPEHTQLVEVTRRR